MDLKDFVKQTIVDLCSAVSEADEAVKQMNGLVNPGRHTPGNDHREEFFSARTTIEFDVAVTASSGTSKTAEGGAKIWVLSAGIGAEVEEKDSVVSRIKFPIQVVLPSPKDQKTRVGKVERGK
ncbi:MAG: trypco2 family protein [Pseudomonadota bacterium]